MHDRSVPATTGRNSRGEKREGSGRKRERNSRRYTLRHRLSGSPVRTRQRRLGKLNLFKNVGKVPECVLVAPDDVMATEVELP